ncbi:hypothetical protein cypCar_00048016, partial [Cyprinus carpio]
FPACQPLSESCSELLPATFLQPPLPMLIPFIERMCSVTDNVIAEKPQQVEPLPQLLMKTSKALSSESSWTEGVKFVVVSVDAGWLCDLRCEILPESDHCLSVTFSLDDNNHLAVRKTSLMN